MLLFFFLVFFGSIGLPSQFQQSIGSTTFYILNFSIGTLAAIIIICFGYRKLRFSLRVMAFPHITSLYDCFILDKTIKQRVSLTATQKKIIFLLLLSLVLVNFSSLLHDYFPILCSKILLKTKKKKFQSFLLPFLFLNNVISKYCNKQ